MDREEFERLNSEEQERVFRKTPLRERGELIFHSHDPLHLVQSLSLEELYLMTREMDLEERSEVMRYATLPQLLFVSDMDCWKKDRIHPKGLVEWLETLLKADEERLLAWLVEMDYEMVVSGFRQLIQVIKTDFEYPSDELLGDEPYFSLDERYYILVEEENLGTVKRTLEILFENHRGRYTAILEGILGELDYELEEEAYQRRAVRLAGRGFPDIEAARQIYRPLSREEFEKFPRKNYLPASFLKTPPDEIRPPHYLTLWSSGRLFLDEVLLFFREEAPEVGEALEEELAWISNKVIACDGIDLASEEKVRQGVDRAKCFLNIGLESLSDCDLLRARGLLKERWLELIFRWGVTQSLELRDQALQIARDYWQCSWRDLLDFLNEPYEPIFRGLFQTVPEYFEGNSQREAGHRNFKDSLEIEKTRRAVLQIEKVHHFLAKEFPKTFPQLQSKRREGEEPISLFSLLGNAWVSFILKGKTSLQALAEKEMLLFLKKGFEPKGGRRILNLSQKQKFLDRFFSREDQDLLRSLWALVFQRLEEELGLLHPSRGVDPRFVSMLYIGERQGFHR